MNLNEAKSILKRNGYILNGVGIILLPGQIKAHDFCEKAGVHCMADNDTTSVFLYCEESAEGNVIVSTIENNLADFNNMLREHGGYGLNLKKDDISYDPSADNDFLIELTTDSVYKDPNHNIEKALLNVITVFLMEHEDYVKAECKKYDITY